MSLLFKSVCAGVTVLLQLKASWMADSKCELCDISGGQPDYMCRNLIKRTQQSHF